MEHTPSSFFGSSGQKRPKSSSDCLGLPELRQLCRFGLLLDWAVSLHPWECFRGSLSFRHLSLWPSHWSLASWQDLLQGRIPSQPRGILTSGWNRQAVLFNVVKNLGMCDFSLVLSNFLKRLSWVLLSADSVSSFFLGCFCIQYDELICRIDGRVGSKIQFSLSLQYYSCFSTKNSGEDNGTSFCRQLIYHFITKQKIFLPSFHMQPLSNLSWLTHTACLLFL